MGNHDAPTLPSPPGSSGTTLTPDGGGETSSSDGSHGVVSREVVGERGAGGVLGTCPRLPSRVGPVE